MSFVCSRVPHTHTHTQGYLKAFRGSSSPGGKACPHHRSSTSCLLSEQVSELKSYIQVGCCWLLLVLLLLI